MLKILLVDDTKAVHAFVKALLAKSKVPVEVTSVFDGEEALAVLAKGPWFDLILLDWEMPRLNGPETLARIKAAGKRVPVAMMTTKNSPDDIAGMLAAGASEYLMKPFTADILFEKIGFVLGRSLPYAA